MNLKITRGSKSKNVQSILSLFVQMEYCIKWEKDDSKELDYKDPAGKQLFDQAHISSLVLI